jgi:MoaE-MoaD fusion protein
VNGTHVRIDVRLFGGLTERVGTNRTSIELPDDACVGDLRRALSDAHPTLAGLMGSTNIAVDLEVADDATPLAGSREVALLPPVAGGADARGPVVVRTGLQAPPFDVDAICAEVVGSSAGGTAMFLGTVRDHAPDLDDVVALEYSAYPTMAEKVLDDIAAELIRDHPAVTGIALLHAVGELAVGAHTILIVCASAHRAAAFDACRDALERVKDRAPVWKREITADGGHRWVGLAVGDDGPRRTDDTMDEASDQRPGVRVLPAREAAALLDRDDTVVLDIRTDAELAQARIPGAVQLDFYDPAFATRLAALDRDATYLLYCRSGARTGQSHALLTELGFRDVVDIEGGLIAWVNAELPLER